YPIPLHGLSPQGRDIVCAGSAGDGHLRRRRFRPRGAVAESVRSLPVRGLPPMPGQTTDPSPVILLAFANEQEGRCYLRDLPEALRSLARVLGSAEGRCKIKPLPNATLEEVLAALRAHRNRVAILHYGGHAGPDTLLLESAGAVGRAVYAAGLATILGQQS